MGGIVEERPEFVLAANVSDDEMYDGQPAPYFAAEDIAALWQINGEEISGGQCRNCGANVYLVHAPSSHDPAGRFGYVECFRFVHGGGDGCGTATLIRSYPASAVIFP